MARRSTCNKLPGTATRFAPHASVPGFIDSSLVGPRAALTDAEATTRMASDMREALAREGGLDREDLERLGYTGQQIERLHRPARLMANLQAAAT